MGKMINIMKGGEVVGSIGKNTSSSQNVKLCGYTFKGYQQLVLLDKGDLVETNSDWDNECAVVEKTVVSWADISAHIKHEIETKETGKLNNGVLFITWNDAMQEFVKSRLTPSILHKVPQIYTLNSKNAKDRTVTDLQLTLRVTENTMQYIEKYAINEGTISYKEACKMLDEAIAKYGPIPESNNNGNLIEYVVTGDPACLYDQFTLKKYDGRVEVKRAKSDGVRLMSLEIKSSVPQKLFKPYKSAKKAKASTKSKGNAVCCIKDLIK